MVPAGPGIQENSGNLKQNISGQTPTVPWPPQVAELKQEEQFSPLIQKVGVCIWYALVLLLRNAWAVHDMKHSEECPNEVSENEPGVVIVDKDDFRNDMLTGRDTSHRTNVMYVQPVSLEHNSPECGDHVKDAKELASTLKEMVTEMHTHERYVTHKLISGESHQWQTGLNLRRYWVLGLKVNAMSSTLWCAQIMLVSDLQRFARMFLVFSAFQAMISPPVAKSKVYYFMTYPEPPNKSILNDVMLKVYKAVEKKHRRFAVVVGDQPVYKLPAYIKNNYPENVKDMFTSLHTQFSMIHTIYKVVVLLMSLSQLGPLRRVLWIRR